SSMAGFYATQATLASVEPRYLVREQALASLKEAFGASSGGPSACSAGSIAGNQSLLRELQ
ncbi:MAG TPA: hypothetical protein VFJ52_09075, partial [Terriglobia bacterium]|nr:hypothetical protein [Terriglobia bacterium]